VAFTSKWQASSSAWLIMTEKLLKLPSLISVQFTWHKPAIRRLDSFGASAGMYPREFRLHAQADAGV